MDELDEVLDIQQRQKRAQIIRRYQSKIERAREIAKKRMAPDKNIKKRAYAQARQIVRKRFAGQRGAEYEKLGPSEKMAIDKAIEKKQALIKKIALRLIPRVKQAEAKRLSTFMHGQKLDNLGQPEGNTKVNEEFTSFFENAFSANQLPDENNKEEKKPTKKAQKNNKNYIKFFNKFGEEVVVSKRAFEALEKKSEKSGIDVDTLAEVYNRGREAWVNNGKVTQEQYAFARVNSFINQGRSYFEEDADLHGEELVEKRGLWDNIHAKRKRIKAGSGERMRKPGSKGAPTAQDFKDAQESVEIEEANHYSVHKGKEGWFVNQHTGNGVWHHSVQTGYHDSKEKAVAWAKKHAGDREHKIDINESEESLYDKIQRKRAELRNNPEPEKDPPYKRKPAPTAHDRDRRRLDREDDEAQDQIRKRLRKEETDQIDESNNTPYVKPHIEKGSTKQSGWKASNKHGRVKYFGMDFKKSAEKHAGISEEVHDKCGTPECCGKCDPSNREIGTKSLTKVYKEDTPGQNEEVNTLFTSFVEDVKSAEKAPVVVPTHTDAFGNVIPAKTVMRKSGRKIIKADGNPHDGK